MAKIKYLIWTTSFKRAYKRRVAGHTWERAFPDKMNIFVDDPFDARLKTHKLSGKLEGLWSFAVGFDCRVIFEFVGEHGVLLIDIGTHDEVY